MHRILANPEESDFDTVKKSMKFVLAYSPNPQKDIAHWRANGSPKLQRIIDSLLVEEVGRKLRGD